MDIEFLAKGFIIGLSVAAPVGPIGVLCVSLLRARLDPYLSHVNKLSGLVIGAFGVAAR